MTEQEEMYGKVTQNLAYEGASTSYREGYRGLVDGDPDTLAAREIRYLQMRSEHAIRNNGYAQAALDKYVTNAGAIKVKWKDSEGEEHSLMQGYWDEFEKDSNLDGYGNLNTTQVVAHSSIFTHGASFLRLHIRRTGNKNKVPLKLQAIPAQLHDITFNGLTNSLDTKYGIKFADTKPVEYYFRKGLWEQDFLGVENKFPQLTVPADEILHTFIRYQPGQWIGIPKLSSVLLPLYEIDELTDATVAKQKAAQAISWIIENTNPLAMTPTGSPLIAQDKDGKDKVVFKSQGGNVQYLNKGEKINFYQSTDIGANLQVLIKAELYRIAAAVGIPYYQLTGDTNGLDFSSIRAIAIELRNRIEFIHLYYTIPLLLSPLTTKFKDLALLYNVRVANAIPTFQLPRWRGIDDLKDTQADLLEVMSGMATLESKLDERHTTFKQVIADRERIKELGLDHILTGGNNSMAKQGNNVESNSNSTGN